MQTREHRSHLVDWRFEYLIIASSKFKVVGLWQREEVISWSSWLWVYFIIIKMCFLIIERSIGEIEEVVDCFPLSLSSHFGPLPLGLGGTFFPTLHKSPPINFEKAGTL